MGLLRRAGPYLDAVDPLRLEVAQGGGWLRDEQGNAAMYRPDRLIAGAVNAPRALAALGGGGVFTRAAKPPAQRHIHSRREQARWELRAGPAQSRARGGERGKTAWGKVKRRVGSYFCLTVLRRVRLAP